MPITPLALVLDGPRARFRGRYRLEADAAAGGARSMAGHDIAAQPWLLNDRQLARRYGRVEFAGSTFGQKAHEFRKFIDLPHRTGTALKLRLDIHAAETSDVRGSSKTAGDLTDPVSSPCRTLTKATFTTSAAEFSVAQGIYVETDSGWFSDRTACYLASGRPASFKTRALAADYPWTKGCSCFVLSTRPWKAWTKLCRTTMALSRGPRACRQTF